MLNTADGSRKAHDNKQPAHMLFCYSLLLTTAAAFTPGSKLALLREQFLSTQRASSASLLYHHEAPKDTLPALGRRSIWFEAETQSLNPDVSCYLKTDGMWACAFDVDLKNKNNVDLEDSW